MTEEEIEYYKSIGIYEDVLKYQEQNEKEEEIEYHCWDYLYGKDKL